MGAARFEYIVVQIRNPKVEVRMKSEFAHSEGFSYLAAPAPRRRVGAARRTTAAFPEAPDGIDVRGRIGGYTFLSVMLAALDLELGQGMS